MDNTVKKKLSVFRKRQTVFVIIYGLINVAVIAGIIAYYRLKEQALAGALYLQDNAYGEAFVRKMFSSGITDKWISCLLPAPASQPRFRSDCVLQPRTRKKYRSATAATIK